MYRPISALAAGAAIALAGCSATSPADPSAPPASPRGATVTVVTHDSFAVPDDVVAAFEASSGIDVEFVDLAGGGAFANQLILTKDAPLGDVVYGIDLTVADQVVAADLLEDWTSSAPAATSEFAQSLPAPGPGLTPIDFSDVCLNVDLGWFEAAGIHAPATLEDLTDPQYAGLLSVSNPATSAPGLAFFYATLTAFGDGWIDYWTALRDNGLRVTGSWSDTYFVDFSAPNYGGEFPIVLSYASSPPSELIDGEPTTAALLDTCFRTVEYAGVLRGTANPDAAQAVVDWMLSDEFQSTVATSMYVYPVSQTAEIPDEWRAHAPLADHPWGMPDLSADERDRLVVAWTELVLS